MKKIITSIYIIFASFSLFGQTANITSGCAPLTVEFTPPAGVTNYLWQFGDGSSSDLMAPGHTFDDPGTFVTELFDGGTKVGELIIKVFEPTQVMISANEQEGCAPHQVQFSNLSIVDPDLVVTGYLWDFGDGGNSTAQNPTYTYQNEGTYTVSLRIESDEEGCTQSMPFPNFIQVSGKVNAGFSLNQTVSCETPGVFVITNNTEDASGYIYTWDFDNGESSNEDNPGSITYEQEGTYQIKLSVDNGEGCIVDITRTVKVGEPDISLNVKDTACINIPFLFINNSNANLYEWSFGSGADPETSNEKNPTVEYSTPGPKIVTLSAIASDACKSDTFFTIFVEDPSAAFTIDPLVQCFEPATYTFNHPNPNFNIYNYNIIELDEFIVGSANEQFTYVPPVRDSFYINRPDTFNVALFIETNAGCRAADTSYFIHRAPQAHFIPNISRGCAPLTVTFSEDSKSIEPITNWSWIFGDGDVVNTGMAEDMTHTYTEPGEYYVKIAIENQDGCRDTSAGIFIYVGEPLTADFVVDKTEICMYDTISMSTDNLDPRIDAYHFNTDDGRVSHCYNSTEASHQFIHSPGVYPLTLTLEYNGCYSEIENGTTITVNGSKSRIKYMTNCEDPLTVMLQDSSINAMTSIWQLNGDTINMDTIPEDSFNYSFDSTGNYIVTLITNDDTACAPDTSTVELQIRDIKANFDLPEQVCAFVNLELNASLSEDVDNTCSKGYTWFGIAVRPRTLDIPSATVAFGAGEHIVRLITEDVNGCTDTLDKTTTAFEIEADFEISDDIICYPATLDFTDLSSSDTLITDWQWSFNGNTNQNPTNISFASGPEDELSIQLIVQDELGCNDSIVKFIQVYEPVSQITFDPSSIVCLGETIGFTASDFTEQGSFLNYEWLFGGETINEQNPTFQINQAGINPVTLIIEEDSTGCTNQYNFNLLGIQQPTADITTDGTEFCVSDLIVEFGNESFLDGAGAYFWDFGNGIITSTNNLETTTSSYQAGTYDVTLTASSIHGCSDSETITINVTEPSGQFTISDNDNKVCINEEITFTLVNPVDVASYSFDFGEGNVVENMSPVTNAFGFYPESGVYDVVLSLTSDKGCKTSVNIPIEAFQVVADINLDSIICIGEIELFNPADTFGVDLDYLWDFGNGETSTNSTEVIDYQDPGNYTVSLQITNDESGCDDSTEETFTVQPNPAVDYIDSLVCIETDAFINFSNLNPQYTYTIDPDAFGIDMLMDSVTFDSLQVDPSVQEYVLTIVDQLGCISVDTIDIFVAAPPQIPNLFTPNGDEHNDYFDVVVEEKFRPFITVETFKVYNRWGNLIYDNASPALGWDGKFENGNDAPAEVYTYVIRVAGIEEVYRGTVTLIK